MRAFVLGFDGLQYIGFQKRVHSPHSIFLARQIEEHLLFNDVHGLQSVVPGTMPLPCYGRMLCWSRSKPRRGCFFLVQSPKNGAWCTVCSWSRGLFSWIFRTLGLKPECNECRSCAFSGSRSLILWACKFGRVNNQNLGHLSTLSCTFQEYQILKRYQEDLHDASQFYTWQERMKEQAGIRSFGLDFSMKRLLDTVGSQLSTSNRQKLIIVSNFSRICTNLQTSAQENGMS